MIARDTKPLTRGTAWAVLLLCAAACGREPTSPAPRDVHVLSAVASKSKAPAGPGVSSAQPGFGDQGTTLDVAVLGIGIWYGRPGDVAPAGSRERSRAHEPYDLGKLEQGRCQHHDRQCSPARAVGRPNLHRRKERGWFRRLRGDDCPGALIAAHDIRRGHEQPRRRRRVHRQQRPGVRLRRCHRLRPPRAAPGVGARPKWDRRLRSGRQRQRDRVDGPARRDVYSGVPARGAQQRRAVRDQRRPNGRRHAARRWRRRNGVEEHENNRPVVWQWNGSSWSAPTVYAYSAGFDRAFARTVNALG